LQKTEIEITKPTVKVSYTIIANDKQEAPLKEPEPPYQITLPYFNYLNWATFNP